MMVNDGFVDGESWIIMVFMMLVNGDEENWLVVTGTWFL